MYLPILPAIALAALPLSATAQGTEKPIWCCPEFCGEADETAALMPRDDESGAYDLVLNGRAIPVMPDAFHGTAADSPMQYCLGFDAFGNQQIKCLFIPALM